MGDRPTTALWGIGGKTGKKLAALGIDTVTQLAESDARVLAAELGPTMGPWYHRIGRGVERQPGRRERRGCRGRTGARRRSRRTSRTGTGSPRRSAR